MLYYNYEMYSAHVFLCCAFSQLCFALFFINIAFVNMFYGYANVAVVTCSFVVAMDLKVASIHNDFEI